jgi:molecular chaperone DnaK
MWNWLKSWWQRSVPAELPSAEDLRREARRAENLRTEPGASPRYTFTTADQVPFGGRSRTETSKSVRDAVPILGIDLGTANAAVAVVVGRSIVPIPNQEGQLLTPCVVARSPEGSWLVGEAARRQAVLNPNGTARAFKRRLASETGGRPVLQLHGGEYPAPLLAALVLRKLKEAAEASLGQDVRRAVVAVPACFDVAQRQAVVDAAWIAGLDTDWNLTDPATGRPNRLRMRLINEPTAAALALGLTAPWPRPVKLAVLHLGAGSFDVSLLDVGDGVFHVEAVGGDRHVGGDDFDAVIFDRLAERIRGSHGLDVRADPVAGERLRAASEQARIDLSSARHARVFLPCFGATASGGLDLDLTLTREQLEEWSAPLVASCRTCLERTLAQARRKPGDVEEVLLVGGGTRMPQVQRLVTEVFGRPATRMLHAGELIAGGAAVQGDQLLLGSRSDLLVVEVNPVDLAIPIRGGKQVVLAGNTAIPERRSVVLALPDGGRQLALPIFQRTSLGGWRRLGEVVFDRAAEPDRGAGEVEVAFELDRNGILDVSGKDPVTGRVLQTRIFPFGGLTPTEVEQLYRELEQERLLRCWRF